MRDIASFFRQTARHACDEKPNRPNGYIGRHRIPENTEAGTVMTAPAGTGGEVVLAA